MNDVVQEDKEMSEDVWGTTQQHRKRPVIAKTRVRRPKVCKVFEGKLEERKRGKGETKKEIANRKEGKEDTENLN